jgi:hypothetical protein
MVAYVPLVTSRRAGHEVSEASACTDRGHTEGWKVDLDFKIVACDLSDQLLKILCSGIFFHLLARAP